MKPHKRQLEIESENKAFWIKQKEPGMVAFIARPNTGDGVNRSVVLVGCKEKGWIQAVKFWNENHRERAAEYVEEYNRAVPKTKRRKGQ